MTIERLPSGVPTIQAWVSALRSGKYQQGEGYLRDPDNAFCCLGVYCDLTDATAWVPEYELDDETGVATQTQIPYEYGGFGLQLLEGSFAEVIAKEIGLDHLAQESLAEMNDCKRSFDEIADVIERSTVEGKLVPEILGEIWTEMQHPNNLIP